MPYTDQTTINEAMPLKVLTQLTDDNNTGEVDTNVVDWAIDKAEATIDAYNNGRYPIDIPDGDVPPFIKSIATDLSIWHLYKRKLVLTIPEPLQKCYDNAIKFLEKGQAGQISPFPESQNPKRVVVATRDRVFTASKLSKYNCPGGC